VPIAKFQKGDTMIRKIKIDYNFPEFFSASYDTDQTCIQHQKTELTDIHKKYGGFPDSYDVYNTNINQVWWNSEQIDYNILEQQIGMEIVTVSTIRQRPGNVIPVHRDTFFQINKKFPDDKRTKVRANIHIEDWKIGHLIQYNDNENWATYTHWKQGEGLLWDSTVEHIGANIGLNDKYTLQLSGFLNE